jgi:mono/diheme cytochrome c family protein
MKKNIAVYGLSALAALVVTTGTALAMRMTYALPPETASFRDGPGKDVVVSNCSGCHSADYIATQPRGPHFQAAFWNAEVNKMIKAYGAPISKEDVPKIVDYLVRTYGAAR